MLNIEKVAAIIFGLPRAATKAESALTMPVALEDPSVLLLDPVVVAEGPVVVADPPVVVVASVVVVEAILSAAAGGALLS